MPDHGDPDRELDQRLRDLERLLDSVGSSPDDEDLIHRLDEATGDLHSLLGRALADATQPNSRTDLDAVVEHVLRGFVAEQAVPLVVRQHLLGRPLPVQCTRDGLLHAVRRALALCTSHAAPGATVDVATREDGDDAVLVVACDGAGTTLPERAVTLHDFAKGLGGRCAITTDRRGSLAVSLSFPQALEPS